MPNIQQQFSGGVLVYLDAVDYVEDNALHHTQDSINNAYSAACQALNTLNRVRMQWQKQNKKEK